MNVHRRAGRAVLLTAALLAAAHFGLQGEYQAAPARAAVDAMPDQQAVQASGFVTYGNGTCFPDAVLLDCSGNVTHQLKGPGGSAYFAAFIGQWVDLAGTELTCVVGDKYISVATLEVKPAPCGTPATPTLTPPPGPTATFTATPPPTLPPGVTPTATPLIAGNLALGKAIYASSQPDAAHPAASAVDGDTGTSWSSIPDPQPVWDMRHLQWIYVDLGAEYEVKDMRMLWVTGRNPRVYAVYVWRDAWNAWQWVARTDYGKVDDPVSFPFEVTGRYFMLWLEVPALAGSHYELAEWQIGGDASAPIQSTNVAAGRASIAYSREPGYDAGHATDANLATEWRSSAGLPQWLYVDLTTSYRIDRAILRWVAGMHATTYTLYSWSGSSWQAIYTTYRGAGAEETVTFSPVNTRYLLVYASAGPSTSVGLRELEVYEARGSGSGLPRPFAAEASGLGLAGWSFGNGSHPVLGQASAAGSMSAAPVAGDESPMVLHGAPPAVPVPVR